jgi:protein-S-isoprenylcysteine O-methyltransferase
MIIRRIGLIGVGGVAGAALVWLSWLTVEQNALGWCLLFVGLGYFVGGAVYLALNREPPDALRERGDGSLWLLAPGFIVVFFGAPLEWLHLPGILPRGWGDQPFGVAVFVAGVLLQMWAGWALGRAYQGRLQVSRRQRLVRSGPYRFVRHPSYAAFVLMAFGVAHGFSSLVALAAVPLLLLPAVANRIWVEEEMLLSAFGGEYRDYQRTTRRMLPGLW